MQLYFILVISIFLQFLAAFLALRLTRVTEKMVAWTLLAAAIFLMGVRRCFTLYEWYIREMVLTPVDIHTEIVGLATSILMVVGLGLIAPLFMEIMRSKTQLKERVEERTAQLHKTVEALELELSERLQAEEALRKSEERFRTVADFTYNWEYWLAPDGTYNYISPSCQRITGYLPADFLQEPGLLEKITHPEDRALLGRHLAEDLSSGEAHSMDFRITTANGEERWIAHVCQPVYDADGRNLGRRVSNRDITQYIKAEEEKAKLETKLRQAQKMEAIGSLAGGIAHDFNNILSPIIMYTEVALRAITADNPIRTYLEEVLKSSLRASELVKQILTVSRQTEPRRILMQLGPIIKEALKLLRASFPATIEIRQELMTSDDWIMADPTEIYQVVMNLCTNAFHAFQDKGGVIEVVLDRVDLCQEEMGYFGIIPPGSYARLVVRDNGQGMTPEVMERIFEPYFTTREIGQGTGLGLAMAHGIIKTCGGTINVLSQPGAGSTFQVYFPLVARGVALAPGDHPSLPTGKERILLVDDEADLVAATEILLKDLGYEVTGLTDAPKALEAFRAAPENFDMALVDQTMPQLTGLDLAKEMLHLKPRLPVLICTGYNEGLTKEKAKSLGIKEVLLKPFIPQQLAETLRRVLDAGRKRQEPGVV